MLLHEMEYAEFLSDALKNVSEIAKSQFGHVSGVVKDGDPNQVLTSTDKEIGRILIERITAVYPDDSIIDEEAGVIRRDPKRIWVVDPIDGTSNFANGIPTYGAMFGLLENGVPVAGGIVLPQFDAVYLAEKGKGAYRNGERLESTREEDLLKTLIAYGIDGNHVEPNVTRREAAVWGELVLKVRNIRSSNSVFDMCMVAEGRYGAFLNRTSKIWDNVAPQVLLEEAGCIYTNYWGKEIMYENALDRADMNFTVCVAPPVLHQKIQSVIQSSAS